MQVGAGLAVDGHCPVVTRRNRRMITGGVGVHRTGERCWPGRGCTREDHRPDVGLYPLPPMDDELAAAVAPFRSAKDAMDLPHARPVPRELVERVVGVLVSRRSGDA